MSQIAPIGFTSLSDGLMISLLQQILLILESKSGDATLVALTEKLKTIMEELIKANGRARVCAQTAELYRLDQFRDEIYRVMTKFLEAIHESPFIDSVKADQAGAILAILDNLEPHLDRLAYHAESTYLEIFIHRCEKIWETAVGCGVSPYVSLLKKTQEQFIICFNEKIDQIANVQAIRPMRQIISDSGKVITHVIGYLNSIDTIFPDQFETINDTITVLFNEYKTHISAEKTRHKHAVEKAIQTANENLTDQ